MSKKHNLDWKTNESKIKKHTHAGEKDWRLWLSMVAFVSVILSAFALRVLWILNVPTEQLFDFSTYYDIAVNVYSGKGYTFMDQPIAFQGMSYSYILGWFFKLVHSSTELTAKIFNVLCSMVTIFATWSFVKKMTDKPLVRWGTLLWVVFLPHHIAYCNTIGTEVFSGALLSGTLAIQVSALNNRYKWPLLGLAIGLMTLTKPFFMAYPIAIGLYEWFSSKNWKVAVSSFTVVFVCMWALMAPWTFRNYQVFHRFIPVSYNSGLVLYLNNNANNINGGYMPLEKIEKTPELAAQINQHLEGGKKSLKLASDLELDLKPAAKKWISQHPIQFLKLSVIRLHATLFNGASDIDAWTMNGAGDAEVLKESIAVKKEIKTITETQAQRILWQRNIRFFQAINDICYGVLTAFGSVFVLANLPVFFRALFSKKKILDKKISIPLLNLGFLYAVILVYEGQPRYSAPVLFLLAYCTMQVVSLIVDYGNSQSKMLK